MRLKVFVPIFLLLVSVGTSALDLKCDKVDLASDKSRIESTYSERWTSFKNLKPDVNETFFDGDVKNVIQWTDGSVSIEQEYTWFERNGAGPYSTMVRISRKDFSWTGYTSSIKGGHVSHEGVCSILEKPKDNAF